jgi:hypothetical protein
MKASELRLKNWCSIDGVETCVRKQEIIVILKNNKKIEPIMLTEEWLINFRFKKDINGYFLGILSFSITSQNEFMICINDISIQTICKYVHQIQNLYFALMGVELPLSSNVA